MSADSHTPIGPKPNSFRERVQEVTKEYWDSRELLTERVAVAQLILALIRTEFERDDRERP